MTFDSKFYVDYFTVKHFNLKVDSFTKIRKNIKKKVGQITFIAPNYVLLKNHNYFPNYHRKLLFVSIEAKSYEDYFVYSINT